MTDQEALTNLLDALPIYATKIGYRTDSTPEEQAFGEAMFDLHNRWLDFKAEMAVDA
jgi:hypothetical protein